MARPIDQAHLSIIRGTGPGAFSKQGPGSVPLRRGLLYPPASDPLGACHLARFPGPSLKLWVWMLLNRSHRNALVAADREVVLVETGLSARQFRRATAWLLANPKGSPYIERVQNGNRYRPTLYRVLRDEALRGLTEDGTP